MKNKQKTTKVDVAVKTAKPMFTLEQKILMDKRDTPLNFRVPKRLKEMLDKELRDIEKQSKVNISLTDMVILKLIKK